MKSSSQFNTLLISINYWPISRTIFSDKKKKILISLQLPVNKRNKAYKMNASSKMWEQAIHEAAVLKSIKQEKRVDFYDQILLNAVQEIDRERRSNRRKRGDRCDTPQTFDTAYSSMKQSVSPASLSPTLNELDRNYDVDKNINNYLQSVEQSHPEELPEEDLQMDEPPSFTAITESTPSSTDLIYCRLTKLVFDKFRDNKISVNQSVIENENNFSSSLNELWSQMANSKLNASVSTNSSSKRTNRFLSIDSTVSRFSTDTQHQTERQKSLAIKKDHMLTKQLEKAVVRDDSQNVTKVQKSKDEIRLQKQKQIEEQILDYCMANHPANFLLKGLPKDPICHCCLESGNVMRCAGKCSAYFHEKCLPKVVNVTEYNDILKRKMQQQQKTGDTASNEAASCIVENIDQIKCTSCSTRPKLPCFVCSVSDGKFTPCCNKNCGTAYHIECLKYWPQHKKTYTEDGDKIESLSCPRHVCQTCVSEDIRNMSHYTESDRKLIKCLLCPATYHRLSECIPAGSELLSESQLICARHQSPKNLKRINIDFCLFCTQGGSLICCDACAYSFHPHCLKVPVGDQFNCEVSQ